MFEQGYYEKLGYKNKKTIKIIEKNTNRHVAHHKFLFY